MDIKEFAGGLAVIDGEVYEKIMVRRAGGGRIGVEYIRNVKDINKPGLTKVIRETSTGLKEVYVNFGKCNISEIQRVCECDAMLTTFSAGYRDGVDVEIPFMDGKRKIYTPAVRFYGENSIDASTHYIDAVLASENDTYYVRLTSHNVKTFMANVDHYLGVKYDKICEMFNERAEVVYRSNPYDDRSDECLIESVLNLIATDCIIDTLRKPKVNESLTMDLAGIVVK